MKAARGALPLLCPAVSTGLNLKDCAVIFAASRLPYLVPSLSGAWALNDCSTFFSSIFKLKFIEQHLNREQLTSQKASFCRLFRVSDLSEHVPLECTGYVLGKVGTSWG